MAVKGEDAGVTADGTPSTAPDDDNPFADAAAPGALDDGASAEVFSVPIMKRRSRAPIWLAAGVLLLAAGGGWWWWTTQQVGPAPAASGAVAKQGAVAAAPKPASAAPAATASAAEPVAIPPAAATMDAGVGEPGPDSETGTPDAAPGPAATPPATTKPVVAARAPAPAPPKKRTPPPSSAKKPATPKQPAAVPTLSPAKTPASAGATAKPAKPAPAETDPEPAKADPEPAKTTPAAGAGDVNALLKELNRKKEPSAAAGADANLPAKLSAGDLRRKLKKRRGSFAKCYQKQENRPTGGVTVKTALVIASSGAVKSARVTSGGGTSSAVQACIVSVLRGTRFPPFREAQMIVNYPIALR
jgi:hypothetical protein